MPFGEIRIEGLKEFQRTARKSVDKDLPRRLGQANKRVGTLVKRLVDARSDPQAVGEGAGAAVRPSASKREVLLRVGATHRAGHTPERQWGKRLGRKIRKNAPKRPHIRGIVEDNRPKIEREILDATMDALSPAFHDTE